MFRIPNIKRKKGCTSKTHHFLNIMQALLRSLSSQVSILIKAINKEQAAGATSSLAKMQKDPSEARKFLEELKGKDKGFANVIDVSVLSGMKGKNKANEAKNLAGGGESDEEKRAAKEAAMRAAETAADAKQAKMEACRRAETKAECDKYCLACSDW